MPDLSEQRDIATELQRQIEALGKINKEILQQRTGYKDLARDISESADNIQSLGPVFNAMNESLSAMMTKSLELALKIGQSQENIGTNMFEQIDYQKQLAELNKLREDISKKFFGRNKDLKDILESRLETLELSQDMLEEHAKTLNELNEAALDAGKYLTFPLEKIKKIIDKLPGGKSLSKMLGLDVMMSEMSEEIAGVVGKGFLEMMAGSKNFAKVATTTALGIGKAFSRAFAFIGPVGVALIAIVATLTAAIARFIEIDKLTREIRANTGFTGENMEKLAEQTNQLNLEFQKFGINLEEAMKISVGLVKTFGSLEAITEEDVKNVAQMSKLIGISGEEGARLYKVFIDMAGGSSEIASNIAAITKSLAEQRGVAPQDVFKDIAENAEFVARFTHEGGQNIALAAVEARRLGVNLGTVAKIADGLLDFEKSIRGQMEAAFFIGRNLNLDRARYLAFTGDIVGLQRELLNQLGSVAEFEQMNPIARQKFAQAIGISADELLHMLTVQERLNVAADDTLTTYQKMQQGVTLNELLALDTGVMTDLELFQNSIRNLGASLGSILYPAIKGLSPLLKGLGIALNLVAEVLQLVGKGVKLIVDIFSGLVGWIIRVTKESMAFNFIMKNLVETGETLSNMFKSIRETISGFTTTISDTINENKALKATLDILGEIVGTLTLIFTGIAGAFMIAKTAMAAFSGAVLLVTKILAGLKVVGGAIAAIFGAISAPVWIVVGAVAALTAGAVLLIKHWDKVSAFFGNLWEMMVSGVEWWQDKISDGIDMVIGLFSGDTISNALAGIVDSVKETGKDIFNSLISPFTDAWNFLFGNTIWSADTIKSVFDPILSTFSGFMDIIMKPLDAIGGIVENIFGGVEQPELQDIENATIKNLTIGNIVTPDMILPDIFNEFKFPEIPNVQFDEFEVPELPNIGFDRHIENATIKNLTIGNIVTPDMILPDIFNEFKFPEIPNVQFDEFEVPELPNIGFDRLKVPELPNIGFDEAPTIGFEDTPTMEVSAPEVPDFEAMTNIMSPETEAVVAAIEKNTEVVMPEPKEEADATLTDLAEKLDVLIELLSQDRSIYMDGREVGKQVAKRLPKKGL